MEAYNFETTVLENGIIQIPEIAKFAHHSVEIIVMIKPADFKRNETVEKFLEKWTGFLKVRNGRTLSCNLNE